MLEYCSKCHKFTVEHDEIAHIRRCLNTECRQVEYDSKTNTDVPGKIHIYQYSHEIALKLKQNRAAA